MNGIRSWRFIFMIAGSILGIIGILCASIIWLIRMACLENLYTSYLSPFAPFDIDSQKNAIIKVPTFKMFKRPKYISQANPHRQRRSL